MTLVDGPRLLLLEKKHREDNCTCDCHAALHGSAAQLQSRATDAAASEEE